MTPPPPQSQRGFVAGLRVQSHDHGGFLVTSEVGHGSYLVRLDEKQFPLGACDCPDHRIRIKAALDRGVVPDRLLCKHSRAVWAFLYSRIHNAHQ